MFGIRRRLFGYMICRMRGGQCHRVINICRKRRIYLWHIRFYEKEIGFCLLSSDYEAVKDITDMCGGSLIILEKKGLPYLIEKNKKHCPFFAGILLAVFSIYIMSLYIWNVEVTGNSYYTEETINTFLNDIGAGCGVKKSRLVPSKIEEEMRIRYPFVSWVSVQIVGTKLLIAMEEGVQPKDGETEKKGDILAQWDGVVVSIMTRKGTPLVHVGDEVKKGDILVRGSVDVIGDDQSVVQTIETGADGDIVLRVDYPVSKDFDRSYRKKQYTGNTDSNYCLNISGHSLTFGKKETGYEAFDTISHCSQWRLTKNFYLPVTFVKNQIREYRWETLSYSDDQLELMMDQYVDELTERIHSENGRIIENHLAYQMSRRKGTVNGYLTAELVNE